MENVDICGDVNGLKSVQNLKIKNPSNILISYLNINSIRNKFSDLKTFVGKTFDILTIAESKLDESFPSADFKFEGFHFPPFRIDCTSNSGGLLTYVRNDIPVRQLSKFEIDPALHILPLELRLKSKKLLIFNIYRPDRINVDIFFNTLSEAIYHYEPDYDNIYVYGDFNLDLECI